MVGLYRLCHMKNRALSQCSRLHYTPFRTKQKNNSGSSDWEPQELKTLKQEYVCMLLTALALETVLADGLMPLDMIDNKTQEIKAADDETYSKMLDLADELPDSSPRFILLSYPLTLASAYILLAWQC